MCIQFSVDRHSRLCRLQNNSKFQNSNVARSETNEVLQPLNVVCYSLKPLVTTEFDDFTSHSFNYTMSSIGTGYDLSASQFSPDGRVFQVEYAQKAVENSGTAVALRGKDGVVFAVEKLVTSKLYEAGANRRIFNIDAHIGMAVAGLLADSRQIVETARTEASNYRAEYGGNIPVKYLADRVAMYKHAYTLYSAVRPFGCSVALGSYDEIDGPQLFMVDPSGVSFGYLGCAMGKARQAAKTEMEKLKLKDMTCMELLKEAAKIIYVVHDEVKDKHFELELGWVGAVTQGRHQKVPQDVYAEVERYAKSALEDDSDSGNDDM